jgi:histidinol-phosphate aminotransferase
MIDKLVSKRAIGLESYKVEPVTQGIALDKNEMPWSLGGKVLEAVINRIKAMDFNRYPDSSCTELKAAVSGYTGIDKAAIAVGNGSDELISVLMQTFIDPGDTIAVNNPSFSMYKIYGTICGARVWEYELDGNFKIDLEEFMDGLQREKPKLVFLCTPNNPTGNLTGLLEIERLLKKTEGIVVVDEAYFEFSGQTAAGLLSDYENLIILRTFSKAFGLAGLRLGYMLAAPSTIRYIDRVRSPFNVNALAQVVAVEALNNLDTVRGRIELIKFERERLAKLLNKLEGLQCYESRSNFLLLRTDNTEKVKKKLQEANIYVKGFSGGRLKDCIRVTIGNPVENDRFYELIKEVLNENVR